MQTKEGISLIGAFLRRCDWSIKGLINSCRTGPLGKHYNGVRIPTTKSQIFPWVKGTLSIYYLFCQKLVLTLLRDS
ncbi:hypothetical protein CANCADRAFT_72564 [Tortispora caseinolytica NRRL Y-17796]|uniref:Uncharacterized protein n=1 Tax=Tortispora caseinolytica NRRL Y-17796 TaxID=767744 RepID=A0A1E4TIJ6_9ASCO|nr:hypothetical protein CANCADRAFT_72564 [Tortispora caseinolytica NRRL Y-17796]